MDGLDHSFGLGAGTRALALWGELARAARQSPDAPGPALAQPLETGSAHLLARVLTGVLELVGTEPAANGLLPRLAELLPALRPQVLTAALRELGVADRQRFVNRACETLPAAALGPIVIAGAATYGREASQPFRELVEKLGQQATALPEPARTTADAAFRSLVRHVYERWSASQVQAGSGGYETLFEPIAATRTVSRVQPEPARVLQLALESGALGPIVWSALREQTATESGMRALLDMLKHAPEGRARSTIAEQLATPSRLGSVLSEEPVDWAAADTLIEQLRTNAIRPLLEQLVDSTHRATRRALMDRLVTFGSEIHPLVVERLNDKRWFVVRNMIALLREAGCPLDKVPVDQLSAHPDPRVRRETLQLRLENPALRERALAEALRDPDKHVVRTALQAARNQLPDSAVGVLAQRVLDPAFPAEFRVLSLYLLGRSGYPTALEALIRFVQGGKTLLGKVKLAPKSPEMLAALSGLARSWPNERRAKELLEVAAKSDDAQVLNALHAVPTAEDR